MPRLLARCASGPMPRLAATGLLLLLPACSGNYSPDTYATRAVQQANRVEQGTIVGRRRVEIRADGTAGAAAGAAAGGVAGSQVGQGGVAATFGAIGGGLVGGLLGSAAERAAGDATATEYIVRKGNGEMLSVTQRDEVPLAIRQKVLVITGNQARIVPDYTVPGEAPPETVPDAAFPDVAARAAGTSAVAPPVVAVERAPLPPAVAASGGPAATPAPGVTPPP